MYDNNYYKDCGCNREREIRGNSSYENEFLANLDIPFATAFVRPQINPEMFSVSEGFQKGTLYPDLFSPYRR